MEGKEALIEKLFEKGVLVNKEMLERDVDSSLIKKLENEEDLLVLNEDYANIISKESTLVDWYDLDHYRVMAEQDRDDDLYQNQLQQISQSTLQLPQKQQQTVNSLEIELEDTGESEFTTETTMPLTDSSLFVEVTLSYINTPKKYVIKDFSHFFRSRYNFIEKILRQRQELQSATTIHRLQGKKEREKVAFIGLVQDIAETRKGSMIMTIEDLTGTIKILISKQKSDMLRIAKDIVLDEVIGVSGTNGDGIVFVEKIFWPDVPPNRELKKGPNEEYAAFISDIHVGSSFFLEEAFEKFLKWISGKTGNEKQRAIANKIKYLFIAGDLVDGVGIYPGHENELKIKNLTDQFTAITNLLKKIPKDKQIIICPGNHDGVHLAEPQPIFYESFAGELLTLPNVTIVTNPGSVTIGKTKDFVGFDVLLYHGFSFDYYIRNVESIRMNGGYHRADLIMKLLLQKRHLAPSFTSTPYYPGHKEDPLLIKKIPDFFLSGHIHYSSVANYRGVTMISGSCWQGPTLFQDKLGHEPEPGRVPVVNLKTREIKILKFI
ncbi:hypothetical protein HOI26_05085 [Candidatus Woesearchaeota archaeon]|mgnify:CR=1 FL=1|nr:hypothetical protein [Candidatus Woesearchaeota archaeon]